MLYSDRENNFLFTDLHDEMLETFNSSRINRFLNSIDIYGTVMNFKVDENNTKVTTSVGGIITIHLVLFLALYVTS